MKNSSARFAAIGTAIAVALGAAAPALALGPYYSNEDGANLYVGSCAGADFTVTIDGTEYSPGDVATGFSINSDYSVSAGAGVTVGFAPASIVQGSYGHGHAREPLRSPGVLDVPESGDWRTLSNFDNVFLSEETPLYPGIFFAECSGDNRFAYIQALPGLTLDQAGFAANLEQGVYVSDQAQLDSLALGPPLERFSNLVFAPMSDFRNAAYAFWANYLESVELNNPSARFGFGQSLGLEGGAVEAVWAYIYWMDGPVLYAEEFASSYYNYSNGSDLTESGINDVFEEDDAPSALAESGANVEWLMFAGLLAVVAGSGFLVARRRRRI
jgi:LPXTG-motif cell wall-anchored protein